MTGIGRAYAHKSRERGDYEYLRLLSVSIRRRSGRRALPSRISRHLQDGSLGLCHRRRAVADGDRRTGTGRHQQGPAPVPHFCQQGPQDLSRIPRFLRHGRHHRTDRGLLPPCRSRLGREKTNPLSARPPGRRQIFSREEDGRILEEDYGIPLRYLGRIMSPWAVKRLHEFNGDITKFKVVKRLPSVLRQIAIAKTEPGDENNQDISSLVGKVDIRKLEQFSQDDPDAYSYSGGLCLANQGMLEFVEMFKAPIKVLHPLLTATQEGNYKGTEGFPAIPFDGIILAHSNESEWQAFKNNKINEAFLDRSYIVKVP